MEVLFLISLPHPLELGLCTGSVECGGHCFIVFGSRINAFWHSPAHFINILGIMPVISIVKAPFSPVG